jgi:putative addiction module component (TIGR02574 family)
MQWAGDKPGWTPAPLVKCGTRRALRAKGLGWHGKGGRSAIGRATVPCQRYMTQQALDLLQRALSLSEEERAELASSLLDSLDATVDEGAENAWGKEIARRIADIDSEKAKTVPWEEVRRRISSRLTHDK